MGWFSRKTDDTGPDNVISSRVVGIEELFQSGQFRPAAVQRDYQWTIDQSERLRRELTDAMSALQLADDDGVADIDGSDVLPEDQEDELAEDDEIGLPDEISETGAVSPKAMAVFYIGAIILRPVAAGQYEIFDGLQRLTTLTILLAVLRDLLKKGPVKKRLEAVITDGGQNFRLTHAGKDRSLITLVQKAGEAKKVRYFRSAPDSDSGKRIFDVQREYARHLKNWPIEQLESFAKFIFDHVQVSVIEIADKRLARHTFVATNLYGLPLRRDEVFKGQLIALAQDDEQAKQIEGVWNDVRLKVGDRFEEFLICCDMIERRQTQGADCLGDLIDHLEGRAAKGEILSWLGVLNSYADAWAKLVDYPKYPHGDPLGNHIWRLSFFKWRDWMPLALHWMERHRAFKGPEKARSAQYGRTLRRFAQLHRRCMAITIYEFGEENRAEIFLKALKLAMRKSPITPFTEEGKSGRPLDFSEKVRRDIKAALSLPIENYEVRRSLMLWYEASLWEKDLAPSHLRAGSVEHVLPGKPALSSQWRTDFSDDGKRYMLHNSIGNMGVVDAQVNDEMGNSNFSVKKPILDREGQFDKFKTMKDVEHIAAWTPKVIKERTERMAREIWKELGLADPDLV